MGEKLTGWEVLIILTIAFIIGKYVNIPLAVIAVIGYFIYRLSNTKKKRTSGQENYKKRNTDAFNALGKSKEERENKIKRMFEDKQATIKASHLYSYKYLSVDHDIWFTLSRNISIMEPREREFLRTTFLLYNNNQISLDQYSYFLFALVNGNGKASIENRGYERYYQVVAHKENNTTARDFMYDNCFKTEQLTIKFTQDYLDATVDSAINRLLKIIQNLEKDSSESKDGAGDKDSSGNNGINEIKGRIYGGGAWLAPGDVGGTIFNGSATHTILLGQLYESNSILSYGGEGSLMTIAPPRSGKSQCLVIPNMLNWKSSAVVLDVSGEIYEMTHKWRSKNVGPVYKFNPLHPEDSHCYNPLSFIRNEPKYVWEDARFLADMMIVPSGKSDNPFWDNSARDVLNAAIAYVTFYNEPDERHMSKVVDIMYGIGWDEMIVALKTNPLVASMRREGTKLGELKKETKDSVLLTAQSYLSAWSGENVSETTKKSDWNPLDLRTNGNITIYICIQPNEIDSYLSLLRVFIAQHVEVLLNKKPTHDNVTPILFMLDEFPRLKNMQPIDKALTAGAKYGIRLWMFAQSYGQLKESYQNAEGMVGSCAVQSYMNLPLNDEYTTRISDQLGFRDGPLDTSKEKLATPLELAGPNYRDTILVLATNTKPAKIRKNFAHSDPSLKEKMNS